MKRYFTTCCDRNYLARGVAMYNSLQKQHPGDFVLIVICLDEYSRIIWDRLAFENVITLPLHYLEQYDPELVAIKTTRTVVEYYWTLTPVINLWLLENFPEISQLTYLDSDLYFFSNLDPIFEEAASCNIAIHEHRFPPSLQRLIENGRFNVGLMCFNRTAQTLQILRDWRAQTIEWCYARCEADRMGDQKYLDRWPEKYPGIHIFQHLGIGVAPWNIEGCRIDLENKNLPTVNGQKTIFFHFHSLKMISLDCFHPVGHKEYLVNEIIAESFYAPYLQHLQQVYSDIQRIIPDFNCGITGGDLIAGLPVMRKVADSLTGGEKWILQSVINKAADFQTIKKDIQSEIINYADLEAYECIESSVQNPADIKVSVLVSTFNSEKYFSACMADLMEQSLYKQGNLEIIVIDSQSQQDEKTCCLSLLRQFKNISYLRTKQRESLYAAWNRGISRAAGRYLTNANTDDRHRADALEILSNALDSNPDRDLAYSDCVVTSKDNEVFECCSVDQFYEYPDFDPVHQIHFGQCGPQPMWRKSLHQEFGFFSTEYKICGDYEWWLRLAASRKFIHIPELLGLYLDSPSSIEHRQPDRSLAETNAIRNLYAAKAGITLDFNKYTNTVLTRCYSRRPLGKFDKKITASFVVMSSRWSEAHEIAAGLFAKSAKDSYELLICGEEDCALIEKFGKFSSRLRIRAFRNMVPQLPALSYALTALNSSSDCLQFVSTFSEIDLSRINIASEKFVRGESQLYLFGQVGSKVPDWKSIVRTTLFSSGSLDLIRQARTVDEAGQILRLICQKIEPGFIDF